MKSILVTGANGYIGRHVVKSLLDKGANVIAVDIVTKDVDKRATSIDYNIFEKNIYDDLDNLPDVCLHMAWKDGFVHNSEAHIKFLPAHYEFIGQTIEAGVKQIAVMGTMHEVGYYEGAIDGNTPCNPRSLYGISKNALRQSVFLLTENKDITVQWLRAYYIYGDDSRNNSIFAKLIQAEQNGQEKFPFTSGKNKYDFIHVDELADQISASVMQDEVTGIINCCNGKPVSLADAVEGFIERKGFKIKLDYGAYPDRAYDSPAIWGDAGKISSILKVDEGIRL